MANYSREFTEPGEYVWTVPADVSWIYVNAVAGGGAGGSSYAEQPYGGGTHKVYGGSGGGGGGAWIENFKLAVTPGEDLYIKVGAGGKPNPHYANVNGSWVSVGNIGGAQAGSIWKSDESSSYLPDTKIEGYDQGEIGAFGGTGDQGGYSVVGNIKLAGGYGGLGASTYYAHGGVGGGPSAFDRKSGGWPTGDQGVGSGVYGTNTHYKGGHPRTFGGSGGGAGGVIGFNPDGSDWTPGGYGGNSGPNLGGISGGGPLGTWKDIAGGASGAGGGATIFGNGGNGGNCMSGQSDGCCGKTPTGYGGGGGGAGMPTEVLDHNDYPANGGAGANGYVAIFWNGV